MYSEPHKGSSPITIHRAPIVLDLVNLPSSYNLLRLSPALTVVAAFLAQLTVLNNLSLQLNVFITVTSHAWHASWTTSPTTCSYATGRRRRRRIRSDQRRRTTKTGYPPSRTTSATCRLPTSSTPASPIYQSRGYYSAESFG